MSSSYFGRLYGTEGDWMGDFIGVHWLPEGDQDRLKHFRFMTNYV